MMPISVEISNALAREAIAASMWTFHALVTIRTQQLTFGIPYSDTHKVVDQVCGRL
jgi:hypothetical protein